MKLKKKHVIRTFIFMILIALIIGGALFAKDFFFSNDNKVIYGTRAKDAKKHKIEEETINKPKEEMKEETSNIDIRISGRIINIIIKVKEDTTLEDAKKIGIKAAEYFKEYTDYYDIQIMIDKEVESQQFPIIGYKHHNIDEVQSNIVWTKDRVES